MTFLDVFQQLDVQSNNESRDHSHERIEKKANVVFSQFALSPLVRFLVAIADRFLASLLASFSLAFLAL